ncbi:MAG: regulatory protein RecX [Oscillospiraceae bacterium]|nr:regulatory protein RecX [Oscillospiraceae bacterium]
MALFFDEEFAFSVDLETLAIFGLQAGMSFTDEEYAELVEKTQYKKAKDRAFKLLGYKSYTRWMLKQRLQQEDFPVEVVADVLDRLEELGLLDDLDYARRCAADLLHLKKYSVSRVRQELRCRGVEEADIEEALQQIDSDPLQQIREVVEKKYRSGLSDEKGRRRAVNGLQRLGYSYGQIRQVLNELEIELADGE